MRLKFYGTSIEGDHIYDTEMGSDFNLERKLGNSKSKTPNVSRVNLCKGCVIIKNMNNI